MAGQGSTGNVIAALCSFFIPGLGQLLQGRLLMAIFQFVLAAVSGSSCLDGLFTFGRFWTPPSTSPAPDEPRRGEEQAVSVVWTKRVRSKLAGKCPPYNFFRSAFQRSQAESCALRLASDASGASPARMKP